jgi:hypothetical protein
MRVSLAIALVSVPPAAEAQRVSARVYHVGVLHPAFGERTPALEGLRAGLKAAGLEEGRDVVFEVKSPGETFTHFPQPRRP